MTLAEFGMFGVHPQLHSTFQQIWNDINCNMHHYFIYIQKRKIKPVDYAMAQWLRNIYCKRLSISEILKCIKYVYLQLN